MNILLVNYEYPPIGAGASTASYHIANELTAKGHHVSILTSSYDTLKGKTEEKGVQVYRIPALRKFQYKSNIKEMLSFVISAYANAGKIIREQKTEAALLFFTIPSGMLGPLLKRKYSVPYIISLRGGDVPGMEKKIDTIHRWIRPVRQNILKKASFVVANSKGLAEASFQTDPFPVKVIPNGVDVEFYSPLPENKTDKSFVNFLFAGRFQEQKNLFFLLDQFSVFSKNHPRAKLILAGDGPHKPGLLKHAAKLGMENCVEWKSWSDKNGMRDLYRSADVLINPSLYEGMPNVVLEAMSCGLPVIASHVMGNDELVKEGENGFLFPLNDTATLQKSLTELYSNPEIRTGMGKKSRQIITEHYSWKKVAEGYMQLLQLTKNA